MGQSYQQTTWVKTKDMKVMKTGEISDEDEERSVLSSLDGDEMKKRLQNIVMKLEKLLEQTEGHARTQPLTFLCTIVAEFELEVDTDFRRFDTVTIQDRLSVLGESERGALCTQVYLSSKEHGLDWDLNTIMRGLLSPKETSDVENLAIERKAALMLRAQKKAKLLSSLMGKGVLLLSVSLIKYSWYKVMQENYKEGAHMK